jgi:hypothetical protein
MHIPAGQVLYKKRIGKAGDRQVYGIGTVGGLHLVVAAKSGGSFETLGAGSHPGVARHIAKQFASDVEFDDMAKSQQLSPEFFQDLLPQYVELTEALRALKR